MLHYMVVQDDHTRFVLVDDFLAFVSRELIEQSKLTIKVFGTYNKAENYISEHNIKDCSVLPFEI